MIDRIQNCSTKYTERVRREKMNSSVDILFDDPTVAQNNFLTNDRNDSSKIVSLKC